MLRRWNYYQRIFSAYLGKGTSQLTFWHEIPEVSPNIRAGALGEYYMVFGMKADYGGPFDEGGIPLLDYRGSLGRQYNPIAIAQYGLGNYNAWLTGGNSSRKEKFIKVADWLVSNLVSNHSGIDVWMHNFDWEYRDVLLAPWYSGLAQGQGISVLVRAHKETGKECYLDAARRAFRAFLMDTGNGGVACRDAAGNLWLEEYIVFPPTHILNGFLWGSWGVYDFYLATGEEEAKKLFDSVVHTLHNRLEDFDTGFWSLYEESGTKLPMIASYFYHSLHIVQLRAMQSITGQEFFGRIADRWGNYRSSVVNRNRALLQKVIFKLLYY